MKKLTFIFVIIFYSSIMNCTAQTFIDTSKVWIVSERIFSGDHYENPSTIYYKFFGDSILNNITYTKMYNSKDASHSNWEINSLWREDDSGKVFIRYMVGEEDLVYDFQLNPGETFLNADNEILIDSVIVKPFGTASKKYLYGHLTDEPNHSII